MLPKKYHNFISWLLFCLIFFVVSAHAQPLSFNEAKTVAKKHVYFDRNDEGTLYCGCPWKWVGRSAGRIDMKSCGYEVRAEGQRFRAERIEWEHIVPAFNFGRARQCWQKGGRDYCRSNDPVFNEMSGDLHNLTPTVGEINSDRNNFRFGPLPDAEAQHGQCSFRVDFKKRTADPGDRAKGFVARVYFYMHDRYRLPMSERDQRILMAWDKAYPVTEWELERNKRIERAMGHGNPFVTGEKVWGLR